VLAGYLGATAPAAFRAAAAADGLFRWVMLAHLAAFVAAAMVVWRGPTSRWMDWGPLVAMAILYGELPALMAGVAGGPAAVVYHDALVQHWESQLFGASPAIVLASELPTWMSGVLHSAYLGYYALIFVPPLILFARKSDRQAFETTILALTAAFAACFVFFVYFPVEGPRYAWPTPPGMPHGAIRDFALEVLRSGSSRGAAFPSSHVAVSVTQAVLALKYQRRVGIPVAICAGLLALGAVYGGFHYGVDVLTGAALGLAAGVAALLYAGHPRRLLSMSDASATALADAGQTATD
jgi:membrane-associated phospholipid phosphatase